MKSETLKLLLGYLIIGFVVVAGFVELDRLVTRFLAAGADVSFALAIVSVLATFIGGALTFVTGNEISTRTASQAVRSFQAGASSSPGATVTAQSPTTMTVSPTPPPDVPPPAGDA
jgi:hypothetical protein